VSASLELVIRTPHEVVVKAPLRGARVPTASGMVGLRPRGEPQLIVVEAGLVILRNGAPRFVATAGGLLECDRGRALFYTPFAVVGDSEAEVLTALDRASALPDGELALRRQLGEIEQRIVQELRQAPRVNRGAPGRG
jgi:F0F1-type ATP synthase epsilon subunit